MEKMNPDGAQAGDKSDSAVRIAGVWKRYGAHAAVAGVNLDIGRGEFFSLLGPSGSGKTSLLRAIAGFIAPDEGQVFIDDVDVTHTPPHRRPCNMVFQHYALFPHLDVEANVGFGLAEARVPRDEIRRRVTRALELVRLPKLGARRPHELSGGQQQRVALARALVNEPRVLLLDEPLAALDAKLRKVMQLELKRIQREVGITFIYVTHDQEEALTMSDRIAVMRDGLLEQVADPGTLYRNPASEFVAGFVGEGNLLRTTLQSVAEDGALHFTLGTCVVRSECRRTRETLNSGDPVTLLLRPEEVRLVREDEAAAIPASEVGLAGEVTGQAFLGSGTRYEVTLDDGEVMISIMPADPASDLRTGERVRVAWNARAGYLLRTPVSS